VLPREAKHYFEPERHLPKDKIKFNFVQLSLFAFFERSEDVF